ncbi:MAG: regulatory iron-sulfur-containing complex subunit RicT [Patescibacteria group bacterium]|jgi:cell fate regulator YaaT (PSP1 superfamily)|nr:regulatory iron-sulfur-containing complex subunit RicT [Patescibacteria group bacterium]
MRKIKVQISQWDRDGIFDCDEDIELALGDKVLVTIGDEEEIGTVTDFIEKGDQSTVVKANEGKDKNEANPDEKDLKRTIEGKASIEDIRNLPDSNTRQAMLDRCKQLIIEHELQMKLVDVHISLDNSKASFAFIADGRVDFRGLVRDLTRTFNKTIRLQQLGIRDEARIAGDVGHCGRNLCCRSHLKELASITSDMAEVQQCAHRGSDRISGVCGRLMCCLSYEEEGYKELDKKMPKVGTKVNVDGRKGVIIAQHHLKETVDVEFPAGKGERGTTRVEVDLNRHKKK